jgi:hypothetical protein
MHRLLLLLLPVVAQAETTPDPDAWYPRLAAGAGIGYRVADLGILKGGGAAASVQLSVKIRPAVFVDAHYDYAKAGMTDEEMRIDEVGVRTHTVGVAVRNPLMSFGAKPRGFGGDMSVSGGLAREWIRWPGGGMQRNALMLGAGSTIIVPSEASHRQVRVGFRLAFARAPDPGKRMPGCDGPCDTPTKTAPYDLSFVMEVSCHVGR